MLRNDRYYFEKAKQFKKDSMLASDEVKRLLNTIKLEDIHLIEQKANTQGRKWINITLTDDKMYYTERMNKEAYQIFMELLPLDKHEKLEEPTITKGLLQAIENPDKVFKSFK